MSAAIPYYEGLRFSYGLKRTANKKNLFQFLGLKKGSVVSADYTEKMRIRAVIKSLFEGTEYEGMTEEIQKLMEGKEKAPKVIYLNCLHSFGKDRGLAIYNRIKACGKL